MSNLKKDIEGVLRIEFYVNDHDDCDDSCSKKYYADEAFKRATTQIINLIESVVDSISPSKYRNPTSYKKAIKSKLIDGSEK